MPDMSMTEAAKWAGVTRATIHKAIKGGRLSARKDDGGLYRIDPSELERVYRPGVATKAVDVSGDTVVRKPDMDAAMSAKQREIELLQAWLADARAERDKATAALADVTAAMKLLSAPASVVPAPPPSAPLLERLLKAWRGR